MVLSNVHQWCLLGGARAMVHAHGLGASGGTGGQRSGVTHTRRLPAALGSGLTEINCELALHAASQRHIIYVDSR
jgi:hypothetical protein